MEHAPPPGTMPAYLGMPSFPKAAKAAVADSQLRRNLTHATHTIRAKRAGAVAELDDWERLRQAAKAIKDHTLANLDTYLVRLEENVTKAGGQVHWARDAAEANAIVATLVQKAGADRVVKVKSMATQEIGLNEALAAHGIKATETDLAELIVQLGHDWPSHILVPAIHKNRAEIRDIFRREMADAPAGLTDDPQALAAAARAHLRQEFLSATVGISGANFAIADTGSLVVVESEGNGRMCVTLPETLISVVGIEKILPSWRDLEVFLALLPRSSTAERMNPYTSIWTGVSDADGPREFHLVLLDNGRTASLADQIGKQALRCIRCSACLNVCPVYERTGGHAYGSPYPGPIGAIISPQLRGLESAADQSLPFASTLCGACYDVCPVAINIPEALVHLRAKVVDQKHISAERTVFHLSAFVLRDPGRLAAAQRVASASRKIVARSGRIRRLPPPLRGWTETRDAPAPPRESFRTWWSRTREPRTREPRTREPRTRGSRGPRTPGATP
jgi:L-lactate dehydrogenase complex protein LldF